MTSPLLQRWRALAGEGADTVGRALIAAWAEPQRRYHDQSHLIWLLDEADRRAALVRDRALVGYAIWFHDAVYQPGRPDNETLSADWARSALSAQPELATRVCHVIEMTRSHTEGEASDDAALFLDMDIAILGEPRNVYCAYAAGVRAEFGMFPDEAFVVGRSRFLEQQLEQQRLFRTDFYDAERDTVARANMSWELEELRDRRVVRG